MVLVLPIQIILYGIIQHLQLHQYSLGGNVQTSGSYDYIMYCFAEKKGFSKFGSYTGNGNADGTFVYTGFKPAYGNLQKVRWNRWLV